MRAPRPWCPQGQGPFAQGDVALHPSPEGCCHVACGLGFSLPLCAAALLLPSPGPELSVLPNTPLLPARPPSSGDPQGAAQLLLTLRSSWFLVPASPWVRAAESLCCGPWRRQSGSLSLASRSAWASWDVGFTPQPGENQKSGSDHKRSQL